MPALPESVETCRCRCGSSTPVSTCRRTPIPATPAPTCLGGEPRARTGERRLVGTGVAVAVPDGFAAFVHPRSGLAARHGITIVNAPGTVDAGYRGEIKVCLLNTDLETPVRISRGDRIAQLVIQPVARATSYRCRRAGRPPWRRSRLTVAPRIDRSAMDRRGELRGGGSRSMIFRRRKNRDDEDVTEELDPEQSGSEDPEASDGDTDEAGRRRTGDRHGRRRGGQREPDAVEPDTGEPDTDELDVDALDSARLARRRSVRRQRGRSRGGPAGGPAADRPRQHHRHRLSRRRAAAAGRRGQPGDRLGDAGTRRLGAGAQCVRRSPQRWLLAGAPART